jgi:2-dehydro-3-deoxygluconokinase
MAEVACVGECMIELSEHADGQITRAFGGDTLNTALYLARLGVKTDYVTALGDDGWSDEMIAAWRREGIGTDRVQRAAGRLPGLYVIQTDAKGERRFSYWRDSAPARALFSNADTTKTARSFASDRHVYASGISLSLYGDDGRAAFLSAIQAAQLSGTRFAFDTNFRPRGWPDREAARAAYVAAMTTADVIFASTEDLDQLFGSVAASPLLAQRGRAELILKLAHPACQLITRDSSTEVAADPVATVVDTTAAGDSFAAAYLAARIAGVSPEAAARAGHRLAGCVVQHRGAIIPRTAMPART